MHSLTFSSLLFKKPFVESVRFWTQTPIHKHSLTVSPKQKSACDFLECVSNEPYLFGFCEFIVEMKLIWNTGWFKSESSSVILFSPIFISFCHFSALGACVWACISHHFANIHKTNDKFAFCCWLFSSSFLELIDFFFLCHSISLFLSVCPYARILFNRKCFNWEIHQ